MLSGKQVTNKSTTQMVIFKNSNKHEISLLFLSYITMESVIQCLEQFQLTSHGMFTVIDFRHSAGPERNQIRLACKNSTYTPYD